jgi:uncharacterized protein DUF1579
MNKLVLAITICGFGTAYAQAPTGAAAKPAPSGTAAKPAAAPSGAAATPPAAGAEMTPPKPGPEQDALKPLVRNATGTGTRIGPDGKEMPSKGKVACKWLPGNMWAACDIDETVGTGKTAMKWMGHMVFGYDVAAKQYRAYMTDSFGMSGRMKGTLEGTKMVWESMDEMKMPNMPSKERVTEDFTEPKTDKLTFEGYMNGKWMPMGTMTLKSSGGGK